MKNELDKALVVKYPKIFADRYGDIRETAMCWGFECGDGWYSIIDECCAKIQAHCDEHGYQVKAVQVKEKFGGLRFYTDQGNDEIWAIVDEAMNKSEKTCELCGNPGKITGKYWIKTLCDEHATKE